MFAMTSVRPMPRIYRRANAAGFGNEAPAAGDLKRPATPRSKPLKRPSQRRAHFTVNAIYDAFVRIWRRDGWDGVTTRAVALEAGFSVGTLYEYFPSKEALASGYVRHTVESMLKRIDTEVTQGTDTDWRTRVRRLVAIACGADDEATGIVFDVDIIGLEPRIAEPKHHSACSKSSAGPGAGRCALAPTCPRPRMPRRCRHWCWRSGGRAAIGCCCRARRCSRRNGWPKCRRCAWRRWTRKRPMRYPDPTAAMRASQRCLQRFA
ncbi:TetR/AcrR family transcriptional regulator [Cupriavidus sp. BIC8F]|uniref:TetR/AcrR family transcriptional regulator n=1 Tax=Cupriavidus sp. BIC8F TaxID=3079014 RepID=UPI0029169736|nr:TetR/AcrR family transcriptional regulator [Cupriavidus sp. BIC8F]